MLGVAAVAAAAEQRAQQPQKRTEWIRTPRGRRRSAISRTGWMAPVSLLACMTVTSTVSAVTAAATASAETTPAELGGSRGEVEDG